MSAVTKNLYGERRDLQDLSYEELVIEVRQCHEMFRRCLSLLNGEHAEPVTLTACPELGDSDDLELYYKCLNIYENGKED